MWFLDNVNDRDQTSACSFQHYITGKKNFFDFFCCKIDLSSGAWRLFCKMISSNGRCAVEHEKRVLS